MQASDAVLKAFYLAKEARSRAYAPYSGFAVGAAAIDAGGTIFCGCNVENASYGGTVCAERVALLKAVSEGHRALTDVVVVTAAETPATPCALCLQAMAEFLAPEARIWIGNLKGLASSLSLCELLPKPFGPRQLAEGKAGR